MLTLASLKNQSETSPEITGLIMIDCWPSNDFNPQLSKFYQIMLPILDQFNFKMAVSACYARQTYDIGPLSPIMRNYLVLKQCTIVDVTNEKTFFEYNQNWQITNWLVVGLTWQICLHTRPMGLNNLLKHKTHEEFFIHPKCVLKENFSLLDESDVRNDGLLWQTVNGLGYRLIK